MSQPTFPWGSHMKSGPRKKWLDERGLWRQFKEFKETALVNCSDVRTADLWACNKIMGIADGLVEADPANESLPDFETESSSEEPESAVPVVKGGHAKPREFEVGEFSPEMGDRPPCREDYIWAATMYADASVRKDTCPSKFAWSLLIGSRKDPSAWRNLQDKVGKGIFGGDDSDDDDDRAFTASGLPQALRERFSRFRDEARQLFSGELPRVFGRTAGS